MVHVACIMDPLQQESCKRIHCIKVAKGEKGGNPKYEGTHQDKVDNDSDDEGKYSRGLLKQFKRIILDKLKKCSQITAIKCLCILQTDKQTEFRDSAIQNLQQQVRDGKRFQHLKTQVHSLISHFHHKLHGKSLKSLTLHFYE
jgi:cobalamin biosynthesis Co2+ chelatase CbiK